MKNLFPNLKRSKSHNNLDIEENLSQRWIESQQVISQDSTVTDPSLFQKSSQKQLV